MSSLFPFERLIVYRKARLTSDELARIADELKDVAPACYLDQLVRASMSVPLNIAEGCGRWCGPDRRRFYLMAQGSTFECIPILQHLGSRNCLPHERYRKAYDQLSEIARILTALIKANSEE